MILDVFSELQRPGQRTPGFERRLIADAVAQAIRDCCPDRRVLMPTSRESDHFLEAAKASGLEIVGDTPNPVLEYCTEHKDGIYTMGPQTNDDGADE